MTKHQRVSVDSMTRAEFIAHIAKVYDVPMNLIRYEEMRVDRDDVAHDEAETT